MKGYSVADGGVGRGQIRAANRSQVLVYFEG